MSVGASQEWAGPMNLYRANGRPPVHTSAERGRGAGQARSVGACRTWWCPQLNGHDGECQAAPIVMDWRVGERWYVVEARPLDDFRVDPAIPASRWSITLRRDGDVRP